MENSKCIKSECILEKINKLPIIIITKIFSYSSNNPIPFVFLISKSKKMQELILNILSIINSKNDLGKISNEFIFKYKITQKLYLTLLEHTITNKIHNLPLTLPILEEGEFEKNEYLKTIYNNFIEIFDKYQTLKVYCSDFTYNKKRNKWYLSKISDINDQYFNNCIFMVNNIEDIESIISLLYYNNYLNYKITLTINKIKDNKIKKIIFEDEQINYNVEYPRSIIIKRQFISQLLKLNINFYICSIENKNLLNNISFQGINDYKNKNITLERKKLSADYSIFKNINNIIFNFKNINNNSNNKKISQIVINKSSISFKEINSALKEYQSNNIETIVFQNMLIENSFFNSLFVKFKSNNSIKYNNNYDTKNINNNNIFKFNKNIFEKNKYKLVINFEKDFFEVNLNEKICILNCSELIDFINNYKYIRILYLFNFPLENIKFIENRFIEYIYINNFFNFENGIILPLNNINTKIPKLSKIIIKIRDFSNVKEFSFIKSNDININNITLNLLDDNIEINNSEVVNQNMIINPHKIFSIINSFKGIDTFAFSFAKIKKYDNSDGNAQINFILNENIILEGIKKVDINILRYLNFDNLLIYGHILNGIKTVNYFINKEENKNFQNSAKIENSFIYDLINNNINSFSESNYSLYFKKNYFFMPFIEDIILKINNIELQKFLNNCSTFLYNVNLYNIDLKILHAIQNDYIKNLNIFIFNDKNYLSFDNNNKIEFNLRFIFCQIPSLKEIKILFINHILCFKRAVLPLIYFNIYYGDNNKKILVVDFGNNEKIFKYLKYKKFLNAIFNNCQGYIIFKIKNKEYIHDQYGKIIKPFDADENIKNLLITLYIITLFIIFLLNFF